MTDLEKPFVSVVIPVFNAAGFVQQAVSSVLSQSLPNARALEIILIDDASTDHTLSVLMRISNDNPQVRVLRNERNLGPGPARNRGFAEARGDWIGILDSDDVFEPERLKRLITTAETSSLDAISDIPLFFDRVANCLFKNQLDANGRLEEITLEKLLESGLSNDLDYGLLKPIVSRRVVDRGLWRYPEDIRHGEDFQTHFDALLAGVRFGVLHEPYYRFSTRIGEESRAFSPASVTKVNFVEIGKTTQRQLATIEALPEEALSAIGVTRARASELLTARFAAAITNNKRYGWTTLRLRAWERLYAWLAQDPLRHSAVLIGIALAKLAGHRGPPG